MRGLSCRGADGRDNALVVGYASNCSYDPPMIMVGIVPSRFSYDLMKENPSFVVHFAREDQREAWKYLGSESGRDGDKLAHLGLTAVGGDKSKPVALICASGTRSNRAHRFLESQGFTNLYDVREGMMGRGDAPGWLKRGLPTQPCTSC